MMVNDEGKPLEGAAIVVKGATKGCKSDAKGHFQLNDLSDEDLLVVSYVGFISKVIKPDFTAAMTLEMKRNTVTIETVNINPPPPPHSNNIVNNRTSKNTSPPPPPDQGT